MKHTRYFLFAGLALCTLTACQPGRSNTTEKKTDKQYCLNQEIKQSTVIVDASEREISSQMTLSGKVEYNENDLVAFRSLLEGVVSKVNFELGDYVKKGQVLAVLQSVQIQELHQQRRAQASQIALFEKQLKTKQDLLTDGMTSISEVNSAEHELEAAKIQLEQFDKALKLYRATPDGGFQLVSPKNGYIIQKSISTGQNVQTDSDPLFSISNLKEVWVMVNIYASNLRYIKEGDFVKVRTVAYPDQLYQGKIDKIYNVFDDKEHVLKARVVLENHNLNLMPGLGADIIIDKASNTGKAVAIPNKAKVFHNNKEYIVVYKDDCSLEARQINSLSKNEEYTFIKEKLAPNEKVIASNALLIFEQIKP